MSSSLRRGLFVLFEGVDRCGKTTQARLLVEALNGRGEPAIAMRFPDRETAIGKMINSYLTKATELDDHAVHLLFAANRWEKRVDILSALKAGTHIVMDRYAYSGVAFTSAKPGMDLEWCKVADAGLPMPDLIIYMDLSAADAAIRGGFGEERYELAEFQAAVRARFVELRAASDAVDALVWQTVDARGSVEEVQSRIAPLVAAAAARQCGVDGAHGKVAAPIRRMWDGAPLV